MCAHCVDACVRAKHICSCLSAQRLARPALQRQWWCRPPEDHHYWVVRAGALQPLLPARLCIFRRDVHPADAPHLEAGIQPERHGSRTATCNRANFRPAAARLATTAIPLPLLLALPLAAPTTLPPHHQRDTRLRRLERHTHQRELLHLLRLCRPCSNVMCGQLLRDSCERLLPAVARCGAVPRTVEVLLEPSRRQQLRLALWASEARLPRLLCRDSSGLGVPVGVCSCCLRSSMLLLLRRLRCPVGLPTGARLAPLGGKTAVIGCHGYRHFRRLALHTVVAGDVSGRAAERAVGDVSSVGFSRSANYPPIPGWCTATPPPKPAYPRT